MTDDKPAIIKVQEGKARLAELESAAGEHFHNSEREFSRAIVNLTIIQDEGVWQFATDEDGVMIGDRQGASFEMYLALFCRTYGISRSSIYFYLGTPKLWRRLGRSLDELVEQTDVRTASKLREERIIDIDGRTGELKLPPAEIIENLPTVDDMPDDATLDEIVIARVNKSIDEVLILPDPPLQPSDVRRAYGIDAKGKSAPPEVWFFEDDKGNIWGSYSSDEEMWDGIIIPAELNMPDVVRGHILKQLKTRRYGDFLPRL